MASYDISSGTTLSGITLHSGDSESVSSGGIALSTTVGSGAAEYVASGGSAVSTTVASGGSEYVYSGGSAVSTTVASGGLEFLFSGGSATATDLSPGGILLVLPGASATATAGATGGVVSTGVAIVSDRQIVSAAPTILGGVGAGDTEFVLQGGVALGATISGVSQVVYSGGIASATSVVTDGTEEILSSGTADATSIGSGGVESLYLSGLASGAAVGSDGTLFVYSGGVASGGTVAAKGLEVVSSGGSATGASVASGGTLLVLPGGTATGITSASGAVVVSTGFVVLSGTEAVSSGAGAVSGLSLGYGESAVILPGGSAVSAAISGGILELFSATASFTTISYGSEEVGPGATAVSTTVSGGYEEISSGGLASGTTVASNASQYVLSGGSAVDATVSGVQEIFKAGSATSTVFASGGYQDVSSGGVALATTLASGSYQYVLSGGSAASTTIGSGALAYVYSTGVASSAHVLSGGAIVVLPKGSAPGAAVDTGGLLISAGVAVLSGTNVLSDVPSVLSGNTLSSGESEFVLPSGSAVSATIAAGATLYDYSLADATTVSGGGVIEVNGGGVASGTTLSGGTQYVYSGGNAAATTVSSGLEAVSSGGVASGTVLLGGDQYVYSRGLALGTQIGSGTLQFVTSLGSASGTSVGSGGTQEVETLGSASATAVGSGGTIYVFSVGVATGATISGGGIGWVSSGGLAADADVKSGGLLIVLPGGSATNPDVEPGGVLGSAGVLVLSGSALVSSGDPALFGAVITSGETELVLSGGSAVNGIVSNGGTEYIYSGGVVVSGALILSGGTQNLSGSASFEAVSGGTISIGSGGSAVITTVANGGVLFVESGGSTTGTTVSSATEYLQGGSASGTMLEAGGTQYIDGGTALDTAISSGGDEDVFGTSISAMVLSGGIETIDNTGTGSGIIVEAGGKEVVFEGTAQDTALGGYEIVSTGGMEIGGTIGSGAYLYAETSGLTSNVTIGNGGLEVVYSGGAASNTNVQSGGTLIILPGGSATGTTSAAGGIVISTGVVVLSNYLLVSATAATLSNSVIGANEQEYVLPHGATVSSILSSGGAELVGSGGVASGTQVTNSGGLFDYQSGSAVFATLSSGGQEVVSAGGVAISTTVNAGGTDFVFLSGLASDTVLNGDNSAIGYEIVSEGGIARATTVSSGGEQILAFSGLASATVLSSGGFVSVEAGGTATGALILSGGSAFISGIAIGTTVENGGAEYLDYGGVTSGTVVGSGGFEGLSAGTASGTTIESGGKEYIAGGTATDTTLLPGGTIELEAYPYNGGTVSLNASTDLLTVITGGQTYTQQMAGDYSGETFQLAADPNLTIAPDILLSPACFCRGTRIATPGGESTIEELRIGDAVLTAGGEPRAIRWIGRRSYDGRFAAGNHHLLPVLVRRGALAENVPARDLYVSSNHAIYVDGLLIPAIELVNAASIVQLESVEKVEYFHIELDTHDILLAEGAPAESFVDDQSRGMFHNAAEYAELYPAAAPAPAAYCAPRVEAGEELQAVRARLAARAPDPAAEGDQATALPAPLNGYLDDVEAGRISGWARNPQAPDERVPLAIIDNGVTIAELLADQYRADLAEAGMGDGRHAFELILPLPLDLRLRHVVRVLRASDGRELGLSPRIIEPAAAESLPTPAEPEPPAALPQPPEPSRPWEGYLDNATRERLRGWAREPDADEPVTLLVLDNGKQIARVVANVHREDLDRLGIGRGRHGFDLLIPGGLSPLARHVVEIRRESDGAMLHGAPAVIEPETSFGAALERAVERAVEAVADAERERVLTFLAEQAERLRQLRADTEGQRYPREAARRLRRRWGPEAAHHGLAEPGQRALVIDARVPRPDRDAGSQALLSHMRAFGRLGYAVSFVAADEMAHADANVAGEGVLCCRTPFYASVEEVLRRQADCFDVIYMHRATIAQRYLPLARQYLPRARILYSVADLHWLRLERQAAAEDLPELLPESRRLRFIECTSAWMADAAITHSAHEAELLRTAVPTARVHCVPWEVVAQPARRAFAERRGVAFIGHYGHVPNQDAAYWLVQDIMPLVWQRDPDIECVLVGSDMPEAIRALARPGVRVLGQVDDLGPIHAQVRLTAATLRYGAGVKGKVLNSFAAGVPCVMSPMAAEGLGLPPPLDRLVGADPAGLAALICRLHADEAAHAVAVRAGLAFIRKQHGAEAVDAALRAAIEDNAPRVRPAAPARATLAAG